jgi:hypothetical protein
MAHHEDDDFAPEVRAEKGHESNLEPIEAEVNNMSAEELKQFRARTRAVHYRTDEGELRKAHSLASVPEGAKIEQMEGAVDLSLLAHVAHERNLKEAIAMEGEGDSLIGIDVKDFTYPKDKPALLGLQVTIDSLMVRLSQAERTGEPEGKIKQQLRNVILEFGERSISYAMRDFNMALPDVSPAPSANDHQVAGSHYGLKAFQHWDMVAMFDLDYFQGQITKYVMRWRAKNGIVDLEKAAHFLEKYIEIERGKIAKTGEQNFARAAQQHGDIPFPDTDSAMRDAVEVDRK